MKRSDHMARQEARERKASNELVMVSFTVNLTEYKVFMKTHPWYTCYNVSRKV